MIDFHCHILPGIDDGSSRTSESEELIREQIAQGITQIVATPHFYASQTSISHFLEKRAHALHKVQDMIADKGLDASLMVGAEVYYFPGMGRAEELAKLVIEGTDLILVEMPFAQWTDAIYKDIKEIIEKQHLTVILAHVERYIDFQKKMDIWDKVFDLPVIPQINTGSFKAPDFFHKKKSKFCLKFVEENDTLLGTDCHNMHSRKPTMAMGRNIIEEKLGDGVLTSIDELGERILRDHAIETEA